MKKKILAVFEKLSTTGGAEISNDLLLNYASDEYEIEKVFFENRIINKLPINMSLFFKTILWRGRIRNLLKSKAPDIVVTHQQITVPVSLAAADVKVKSVAFIRDWWFLTPDRKEYESYLTGPGQGIRKKLIGVIDLPFCIWGHSAVKEGLSLCSGIVCVSDFVKNKLKSFYSIDSKVINPPIENRFFVDSPNYKKKFLSRKILFIGRLAPDKGIHVAVRMMRHIDGRLIIIGEKKGPYYAYCRIISQTGGLRHKIHFSGKLPHEKILNELKEASCVVVPSIWQEPFGRVAQEAIATGTPIVTTGNGGLMDCSKNQLVARPQPGEFAKKVNFLLEDYSTFENYSKQAVKDSKKYSINVSGEKFKEILKETLYGGN